jgi:hypothetical protein
MLFFEDAGKRAITKKRHDRGGVIKVGGNGGIHIVMHSKRLKHYHMGGWRSAGHCREKKDVGPSRRLQHTKVCAVSLHVTRTAKKEGW